jgi:copper resistance protein D
VNGDPLAFAQVCVAALGDIAFSLTLGLLMLERWLQREHAFSRSSAASTGRVSAFVLLLCNFASLWLLAAEMSGSNIVDAGASLWLVASSTHAGIGWAVAIVGSIGLLASAMEGRVVAWRVSIGALVAAAGKAAIGHAADAGAFSIAEIVQTVHLLATGVWGGVVMAGALSRRSMSFLDRISRIATVAVFFVLATGVYNAIRGIGGSADVLTMSAWGHALVVKVTLVVFALLCGAVNRWRYMPRQDMQAIINVMRVEALAIVGVFIAASVLSHSVPGMSMM